MRGVYNNIAMLLGSWDHNIIKNLRPRYHQELGTTILVAIEAPAA